jgi:hypothetical protein
MEKLTSILLEAIGQSASAPTLQEMIEAGFKRIHAATPPHQWRELDPKETAAEYFSRYISPVPFDLRATTTDVKAAQPEFYNALSSHCANIKRGRIKPGEDEVSRAQHISELLPTGVPRWPKKGPSPK